MFDTITGLPVHVLVIHAVVVLLPLMAVLTIVVAVRARLREQLSWWVTAANVVMFGVTLVAKQSGEALQARLGGQVAREHGELGSALPWFALFLALASAATAVTSRNRALGPVAVVVSIVAAVAAVFWTVRTGDAGTRA
ncbi:MAG: hypothetical protein M3Z83_08015, partial [Actinomycetota bacterium]|nr:hypothetical protein [Actinomycetota bacterium]